MKGGVPLTQGNTSYLRFSLEESVWFRKGQEVAELLSISLEPNVTIQEQEQYVAIRGSLELTGEYKQLESNGDAEEDDLASARYVQIRDEYEGEGYVFQHYFPVDITIPTNRVNSLHELDVNVDSFDYVLPENNCLKLSAELTVTGVRGQVTPLNQADESYEDDPEEVTNEQEERQEALLYRDSQNQANEDVVEFDEEEEELDVVRDDYNDDNFEDENESYSFSAEARKPPAEEEEQVSIAFQTHHSFNQYSPSKSTEEVLEPAYRNNNNDGPDDQDNNESSSSPSSDYADQVEQLEQEAEVEDKKNVKTQSIKQKTAKGKGISLAEFFDRKQETDEQAKLKVCFVQQGDSVESIAERYEVSVQQLLKVNHLEAHEDIHEGQVLYIPLAIKPITHKR